MAVFYQMHGGPALAFRLCRADRAGLHRFLSSRLSGRPLVAPYNLKTWHASLESSPQERVLLVLTLPCPAADYSPRPATRSRASAVARLSTACRSGKVIFSCRCPEASCSVQLSSPART